MALPVQSHLSQLKTDPLRNFKFLVQISHAVVLHDTETGQTYPHQIDFRLGFTSVDGLNASTNAIPYRQGGYNTAVQMIPGQTSFTPLTLQRGLLIGTKDNFDWFRQLFTVQVGTGDYVDNGGRGFRGDVDIFVLPHPRTDTSKLNPVAHFQVVNAWPTAISYSALNAGDNAFIVEQVTLAHEGWSMNMATHNVWGG